MEVLKTIQEQFQTENMIPVYTGMVVVASVAGLQLMWWQQHRKFEKTFGTATYRPKFNPMGLLGVVFGNGLTFTWRDRFTLYKPSKKELITLEPTLWGKPILYTNSIEVLRQVAGGGAATAWYKPEWVSLFSLYWGNNVSAENDAGWKKHRRILQPAFNPKTYEMVWDETRRLYNQMVTADGWPLVSGEVKPVQHAQYMTQRLALCVILSCGFGLPLGWKEQAYTGKDKEKVNLDDGIKFQSDNAMLVCFAPKWVLNLPFEKMRYIQRSTTALRSWFNEAILKRKAEISEILEDTSGDMNVDTLKRDVFTRIALASQMEGKFHLEDSEIIGNTWIMFFAGHETTASVLAATFCFLAGYQEEQDIVFEEIQNITKETVDGRLGFDQYEALFKTRSAFVEALRMFPAGALVVRETREDTILRVPIGTDGHGNVIEESVPVPNGTVLAGDITGIQYNPRVFPNPEVYRPSRWYDATSDDAFTAFSVGPRVCIGRKFALVEGVCFVAHMLRDYKVEPLMWKGESLDAWKERVLTKATNGMTTSISDAPLRFRRR